MRNIRISYKTLQTLREIHEKGKTVAGTLDEVFESLASDPMGTAFVLERGDTRPKRVVRIPSKRRVVSIRSKRHSAK